MDQRFLTLKEGEPAMATPFSVTLPAGEAIPAGAVIFIDAFDPPSFYLANRYKFNTMLFIAANAAAVGESVIGIRQGRYVPYLVPEVYVGLQPTRIYLDTAGQCTPQAPTTIAAIPVGWIFGTTNLEGPPIEAYVDFGTPIVLADGWVE